MIKSKGVINQTIIYSLKRRLLSARLGPTGTKASLPPTWLVRGLGRRNPDSTRGRPKPMAKSNALPSHGPSQWLSRPLAGSNGSLGHWAVHSANGRVNPPATKVVHSAIGRVNFPAVHSANGRVNLPAAQAVHSAIGRVNLPAVHSANGRVNLSRPKLFTRPMAE